MRDEQIVIDIDNTITKNTGSVPNFKALNVNEAEELFKNAEPSWPVIETVNRLSKKYIICLWTSRSDFYQNITIRWLKKYGVKYDWVLFGKPGGVYYVDDKFMSPEEFIKMEEKK